MAVNISDLLDSSCIELNLTEKRKPELIRELVEVLSRGGEISDPKALAKELLKREKISTTGIGSGIAIPHCLSPQVSEMRLAFGRKLDGAKFDAVDNQPVSLFFLMVGPEGGHARHLQILSKLARYLHDHSFCSELLGADSPEAVIAAFQEKEAQ